ncbi:MAG: hypothetical protein ABSF16_13060 [Terracidiphilus sp.]|jgi:uncharacterized membrane protein
MLSSINFWMCLAGLLVLVPGVVIHRPEIGAAHGWDKLIAMGSLFIAVSLAAFAPEHFGGPMKVADMVPAWMPAHVFWAYFVGCALFAAAASLAVKKYVGLSSTLLGLMFFLFVCMMHIPNALTDPRDRFGWTYALRDLSFAAGAWALAGLHSRASSPQISKWMILSGRIVIGIAAIFFATEFFLHPEFAPGFPLELMTPSWVPFPRVWGYLTGAILLTAGIGLFLDKKAQIAATSIGALMTVLALFLYVPDWIIARGGTTPEIMEAINYVFDTLFYAGTALVLASALPRDPERAQET